jgi:sortase B
MGSKNSREEKEKTRKTKKRKKKGMGVLSWIILLFALVVFCVSGYQLYKILKGYYDGRSEYDKIRELAIINDDDSNDSDDQEQPLVDFDELLKINSDTIGWILFDPEPSEINYPLVQGRDNSEYLSRTFSANENTLGAIFLNVGNKADFSDKNSIVYGHRMKDGSMFRHLQDYDDKSFWESNPYFYIYTTDGRKLTYHIYAAGEVSDTSDIYQTTFASDEEYQTFLDLTKQIAFYDTGVEVTTSDTVVTLSTCTGAGDDHRIVVLGVKEEEKTLAGK